jgi:ribosomal protein L11 methylase PrmA
MSANRSAASFRDPNGFVFSREGTLYRQVNQRGGPSYQAMMDNGLYARLVEKGLLIRHEEVDLPPADATIAFRVLRPQPVPFISYPYEWCFGQLKDAARATVQIAREALAFDMRLKDASAFNMQFVDGRPLLIDSLSFDGYHEGEAWDAYRQFCQHFLAPLALMAHTDVRLVQLTRVFIDGLPLDLASHLLPRRTRLNFGLLAHIHLHASAQQRFSATSPGRPAASRSRMGRAGLLGILDSLEAAVEKLSWRPESTPWADYYAANEYSGQGMQAKTRIVGEWLDRIGPGVVWDLGANTGRFSQLACERGHLTIAFDVEPGAVELNYRDCRRRDERNCLPLVMDLTNPTSGLGWAGTERMSLLARGPASAVLALALVHHLAIGNNVPLPELARFFARCGRWLIVEFVPKDDPQVQRLLVSREDIFDSYTREGFEGAFGKVFAIRDRQVVPGTSRQLYLMEIHPGLP